MQIAPKIPPSTPTIDHLKPLWHLLAPPRKSLPTPTLEPLENLGHLSPPPPKSLPPPTLEYLEPLGHLSPPPPTLLPPPILEYLETLEHLPTTRSPPSPNPNCDKKGGSQRPFVKIIITPKENIPYTESAKLSVQLEYHFLNHYNRLYRNR